jgi:hypothetical protein
MRNQLQTPFTNAQLELLKLFSTELSEQELQELKRTLLAFKFKRVTEMADKVWDEKGWTNEDMDKLLHTHLRTPYKSQADYINRKKPEA